MIGGGGRGGPLHPEARTLAKVTRIRHFVHFYVRVCERESLFGGSALLMLLKWVGLHCDPAPHPPTEEEETLLFL